MVARKTAVQKSTAKATEAATAKTSASGKKAAPATAAKKAAKSTVGKKAAAERAPAKGAAKTSAKNAVAKPAAAERATTHRVTAEDTGAKDSGAKKTPARKSPARKSPAKKTPAKKATAAKAAPAEQAVPAKKTGARKVVAKKTPSGAPTAKQAPETPGAVPKARAGVGPAAPGDLAVRPGEEPWSPEEVAEARAELLAEAGRLRTEILASEEAISGLMRDSGDGAGDDQADTGTKNITREHELALAGNAREMLLQTERALERLDAGTYGLCENCGNPIGKARMQAFPRATLCVECKQRQERR
ncbi:TraR/DksA C4-type zinc finger protein [Streptomyces sparsogenes]|uniref:TraR/DksA family transcriptional regulator n=1 Tax=Streptomyces sparsogenes TaxID=67365 RepID=UPI003320D50E